MDTMMTRCPSGPPPIKCVLDKDNCLSLSSILGSFSAPISEEHCWALLWASAKCGQKILSDESLREQCYEVSSIGHIQIHKDGFIHPKTFMGEYNISSEDETRRSNCFNECKLISSLSLVIYNSLDYGLGEDQERDLSNELSSILEAMLEVEYSERTETDDEGIERDSSDDDFDQGIKAYKFGHIIHICKRRLESPGSSSSSGSILSNNTHINCNGGSQTSEAHYKAVCRALVTEALELSTFLQKVSKGTQQLCKSAKEHDVALDNLNLSFRDWARLWGQVMYQLRNGVSLKKLDSPCHDCTRGSIEYELTPYEILMDDIRSRRYKLKTIMVDGELPPRIKKDAHAIIIDWIRSRPPLKKAQDRVLGPSPAKNLHPIEQLMASIRKEHKLKPAPNRKESLRNRGRRRLSSNSNEMTEINSAKNQSSCQSQNESGEGAKEDLEQNSNSTQNDKRRLIKPDLDFLYGLDSKDDDEDEDDGPLRKEADFYNSNFCPEETASDPVTPVHSKDSKRDMDPIEGYYLKNLVRRHSISNPQNRAEKGSTIITFPFEYTDSLNVFNFRNCPSASPILRRKARKLPHSMSKSSIQEEFFQSNHWNAMECLSLNLEEVVHIRNVLTKAELESLPVDITIKQDVEKGKVCFLCLKTRFSLFGPWSNNCRLCRRTICSRCCVKMRIPTEHFANIPVSSLSPIISPTREDEKDFAPKSLQTSKATNLSSRNGSASPSPNLSRKSGESGRSNSPNQADIYENENQYSSSESHSNGPQSLPNHVASLTLGIMTFRRKTFGLKLQDKTEMVVCHDCRAMVVEIKRSSTLENCNTKKFPIQNGCNTVRF